jgi:NAD(P)-dependent dehydrogenase (short-subunit alcohol dehydrogenase family)
MAMTRQLAMEGRDHGIRVNSISPGLIETNQTREHVRACEETIEQHIDLADPQS